MGISKRNTQIGYPLVGTLLVFMFLSLYGLQLSVPVISDETITMANNAWLVGSDWSLMIASVGGYYYKYLQPLIVFPIFKWIENPEMVYRLTMVIHSILHASIVWVVYTICVKYLRVKSKIIAVLMGMAVCLVPSSALYIFYYRGDLLLSILPWYALLYYLKAFEEKKESSRIAYTIVVSVFCILSYMAHLRGIVVVIAIIISEICVRFFLKKKGLNILVLIISMVFLLLIDLKLSDYFRDAIYSVSGMKANSFAAIDSREYFDIFSYQAIKSIFMLCVGWCYTLIVSTQGMILVGGIISCILIAKILGKKSCLIDVEKIVVLICALVFFGYFAVGALHFKWDYLGICTGELTRRTDSLVYDRYSICGAGMIIFIALYTLAQRPKWFSIKTKIGSIVILGGVLVLFYQKIFPLILKYTGYTYNTITLNTFSKISDLSGILSGSYYDKKALLYITVIGVISYAFILLLTFFRKKKVMYAILLFIIMWDVCLIHVNFTKIRKASNDYIVSSTKNVVDFLQEMETKVVKLYPYILKGGTSGTKIQFYQSQLSDYKMFGKKQEKELNIDNYFIISAHDDVDISWYENDYYIFEDFDYTNIESDIIYVKGNGLKEYLEDIGYKMIKYDPVN